MATLLSFAMVNHILAPVGNPTETVSISAGWYDSGARRLRPGSSEVFDRQGVSFVAVTQAFNTTTSMGRLTLNMLLSFAQFEREVTGERIRDKIAASKRKGMVDGRPAAARLRCRRPRPGGQPGRGRDRAHDLPTLPGARLRSPSCKRCWSIKGIVSKRRVERGGGGGGGGGGPPRPGHRRHAARPRRALPADCRIGSTAARSPSRRGPSRPACGDSSTKILWDAVQARLADNRVDRRAGGDAAAPSLLAGLLVDGEGRRLTPSHTTKAGRRYRYYVSHALVTGTRSATANGLRLPASDLEAAIEQRLCGFLIDRAALFDEFQGGLSPGDPGTGLLTTAAELAYTWTTCPLVERRRRLLVVVDRVVVTEGQLEIQLCRQGLGTLLRGEAPTAPDPPRDDDPLRLVVTFKRRRVGKENRLLLESADSSARRTSDTALHRQLARAQHYRALALGGRWPVDSRARHRGRRHAVLLRAGAAGWGSWRRLFVTAILKDRHPVELTANRLATRITLPADWSAQRTALGLD